MTDTALDTQLGHVSQPLAQLTAPVGRLTKLVDGATIPPRPEVVDSGEAARRLGVTTSIIRSKAASG